LSGLHQTITDFNRLRDTYGLREESGEMSEKGVGKKGERAESPSIAGRFGKELQLRARWVITDKDKFTVLLQDLKDYNDGLERLFPPARLPTLERTWVNELLQSAHRDLDKLTLLESTSSGVYPQLNVSASLKQLRINLDDKSATKFKQTYALKIQITDLSISDTDSKRTHGLYRNPSSQVIQEVIVEWVEYDKEDLDARLNHVHRIDDLARMIHSASARHPDLHTPDCLGYCK
jgi:hypothetical protein